MEVFSQMIVKAVNDKQWKPIQVARGGPDISHIFFTDDLLLFGEASFSQARMMEHLLAKFCDFSGQRISRSKTRLWFSPNTSGNLRYSICLEFHISTTTDLGRYLGVPLIHRFPTRLFSYLLDRRTVDWQVGKCGVYQKLLDYY